MPLLNYLVTLRKYRVTMTETNSNSMFVDDPLFLKCKPRTSIVKVSTDLVSSFFHQGFEIDTYCFKIASCFRKKQMSSRYLVISLVHMPQHAPDSPIIWSKAQCHWYVNVIRLIFMHHLCDAPDNCLHKLAKIMIWTGILAPWNGILFPYIIHFLICPCVQCWMANLVLTRWAQTGQSWSFLHAVQYEITTVVDRMVEKLKDIPSFGIACRCHI